MSIFHDNALIGAAGQAAGGGAYQVSRSLRFNSADSAYLSKNFGSAGNRKTWTWSGWVKRSALQSGTSNTYMQLFSAGTGITNRDVFFFDTDTDDTLAFYSANGIAGVATLMFRTNAVFRDASAWMHVMLAVDTTQATAANRVKLYVNGTEQTFSTVSYPSLNAEGYINLNNTHYIATHPQLTEYFSGYLADIWFLDGIAATPSDFAETDATTGQWIPKVYTGSKGTNGFHLEFADNSAATAAALGKDTSGNSNNWTPNNLSVTAGAGNDSLVDTPTSAGTDTGVGGVVTGNYCTLNPLDRRSNQSLANGNLESSCTDANYGMVRGTIGVSSGKWYWEGTVVGVGNSIGTAGVANIGIATASANLNSYIGSDAFGWTYNFDALRFTNGSSVSYGATYLTGDVIGVALDMDAGTLTFYKNGSSQGQAYSSLSGTIFPSFSAGASGSGWIANFGQRSWAYQAPAGFKALCDTNLPAPVVAKPNTVMDVKLYTGNGSSQSISSVGFSPDLVWIKQRSGSATAHSLEDIVRGTSKHLASNATDAEVDVSVYGGGVTAFNSAGFSVGSWGAVNENNQTYVSWLWDGGSSTVTNTQGSITSTVRANASAGFSIVTYTGNGSAATVGHGLNALPSFFVIKNRSGSPAANNWYVGHTSITWTKVLTLNTTDAASTGSDWTPTSTLLTIPSGLSSNGINYVAYCFAPVAGYSSMGSYVGNGSSDGPAVWLGFRPKWLLIKRTDSANDWYLQDSARDPYNPCPAGLFPNLSAAEDSSYRSAYPNDMLSNGFKLRTSNAGWNASGGTYLYIAFAESPFQYARAR